LESVCWGNSTVGSNPTLSAILLDSIFPRLGMSKVQACRQPSPFVVDDREVHLEGRAVVVFLSNSAHSCLLAFGFLRALDSLCVETWSATCRSADGWGSNGFDRWQQMVRTIPEVACLSSKRLVERQSQIRDQVGGIFDAHGVAHQGFGDSAGFPLSGAGLHVTGRRRRPCNSFHRSQVGR
jgi:hypothetical protein